MATEWTTSKKASPLRTEKRPIHPVSAWTKPPDGLAYRVHHGDTWESLARDRGLDPWALIYYNFRTRDPGEVNWYLREYVGCAVPTVDGDNWSFTGGLSRGMGVFRGGVIYLPRNASLQFEPELVEATPPHPPKEISTATKLYIYDSSSEIDRKQADGRFGTSGVATLGVGSVAELHQWLAILLAKKHAFKRVLFQTHGNSGTIFFNHELIDAGDLRTAFSNKGYHQLFPGRTKIYFDGCNVAEGKDGWDFLTAAGEAFLRIQGGITMGWTSLGSGFPGWIPFVGGHTIHFLGHIKFIEFGPGAVESSRFGGDGASMPELAKALGKLNSF